MNASMWKTTLREIKKSLGRYLAILAIVALGVGFFAGLRVMKAAMLTTGDDYFKEYAFYDFRLISTLGFDDADLEAFQEIEDVREVEGAQAIDFIALKEDGAETIVKAHSITPGINELILIDGRMPQNTGECVVDSQLDGYKKGDTLTVSVSNTQDTIDSFKHKQYTIVGVVQSPLYINYERGNTSIGNGTISGFAFFPLADFDMDYYTEVYLKYNSDYMIYSQEYKNYIRIKEKQMEEICDSRKEIRYETVLNDANQEIADGEKELSDAKQELFDAKQELDDAAVKIQDGKDEIKEKKQELAEAKVKIIDGEKELQDGKQEILEAQQELADGEKEYEEGKNELEDGRLELAEAIPKVQKGRLTYEENLTIWKEGMEQLLSSKKLLNDSSKQLSEGWKQYEQGVQALGAVQTLGLNQAVNYQNALLRMEELTQKIPNLDESETEEYGLLTIAIYTIQKALGGNPPEDAALNAIVTGMESQLDSSKATLEAGQKEYETGFSQMQEGEKTLQDAKVQLDYALLQVEKAEKELADAGKKIADGQKELDDAYQEIENGKKELADGQKELADAEIELRDAKIEIADGEVKLADAEIELADGENEYLDGKKEYEDAKRDADIEIADAENKIQEAKDDIAELKKPDYYVLGRDTNVGYVTFESNSNIVQGISSVFPLFFLLVAALVCITTMNRMVEEQRTQIGILKALGYSEMVIMGKYMVYSGSAALIGCIVGFVAGSYVFPVVIWEAYSMMYSFVASLNFIFNTPLLILSMIVSLVCALGTTYLSCHYELESVAAELIRPKSPKNGKRIFLERLPFIWNRLKFLYKVSIRNVVRYKKRFFMMVIGISGCSALLVTGYGVKDSIANVAQKQYHEVFQYDLSVMLQESFEPETKEEFEEKTKELLKAYTFVSESSADAESAGKRAAVTLIIPEKRNEIENFVSLYNEKEEKIDYPQQGEVVLSKRAAEKLDLSIGDILLLWDADEKENIELRLSGITQNYVSHYAYINEDSYREGFGKFPEYKNIYAKIGEDADSIQAAATVLDMENISSVTANSMVEERFGSMISSMDYVILLIIVCAGALAFIVLYNLTNINITERIREIATIKVLGFYPMETAAYVFRENFVLAAIGAFTGLPLGFLLHRFVMYNIVIDEITFTMQILPLSYVYSILFTFLFALLVNVLMFFKLKRINMAESLKSIE